jgi:hypothetical protein
MLTASGVLHPYNILLSFKNNCGQQSIHNNKELTMAATRLTKELRKEIHNALMERAYTERKEEIVRMEHNLGMRVYNDLYPPQVQEQMKMLPNDFFNQATAMKVAFDSNYHHISLPEEIALAYKDYRPYGGTVANYPAGHELTDAYIKFKKLEDEYKHDRMRLYSESNAILESCTTVKKLIETWPEIEPILQKLNIHTAQSKEVHLPAVIQDMNALFSLPPAEDGQDINEVLAA